MKLPWGRGAHRHIKAKAEPMIEKPSRSIALRERLASPWLVIAQYVFNIAMVALVFWLTVQLSELQQTQQQYSDYLAGKGVQRDAERDQAERDRLERSDATHQVLCNLINALEADIGRELKGMRDAAACELSPFQPGASAETPGLLQNETSQLDPIVPGSGTSTGSATPGSETATGEPGAGNGGPESARPTGSAGGGEGAPEPPGGEAEPPPSSDDDRGGLLGNFDLCAPFLGCPI